MSTYLKVLVKFIGVAGICVFGAAFAQPVQISGSVGAARAASPMPNHPDDVRAVKGRLLELGYDWLPDGDRMDDTTIGAIRLFQSIVHGHERVGGSGVDGIIDPGGATIAWLNREDAPRWQSMPEGGTGFYNYELLDQLDDDHDYGTHWLADTIAGAGAAYEVDYRYTRQGAALITVNDASRDRGRDTPDHFGHETGLAVDIRLPKRDGSAGKITFGSEHYDRDAARAMLLAFHQQPRVVRARCNDDVLARETVTFNGLERQLCETDSSGNTHDDHIHIDIRPPQ